MIVLGDSERQLSFCLNCSYNKLIDIIQHWHSGRGRQNSFDATFQAIQKPPGLCATVN